MRAAIIFLALMATPAAAQPSGHVLMTNEQIGPVHVNTPIATLPAQGLRVAPHRYEYQANQYTNYIVRTAGGQEIVAEELRGRVASMSTRSPIFITREGAHVGMTLADLRRLYPRGESHVGHEEEGDYFTFAVDERGQAGVFVFDARRLPRSCFESQPRCPDLSAERATEFVTSYMDPLIAINARSIGSIALGMSADDIASLGFRTRRAEGGDLVVSVVEGREVLVHLRDGRAWRLTTTSGDFQAYRGARVGATMDQLRWYYPEGRMIRSISGGLHFSIGPGQFLTFDVHEPTQPCTTDTGAPCPAFGQNHAIRMTVEAGRD
ncbi:MAG: hypothetical protein ABUS57_08010 [Pseudomonadota bacterium]